MTIAKTPISGAQYELSFVDSAGREHLAAIASVAASLRAYSVAGVDVVRTYPPSEIAWHFSGMMLSPWVGRMRSGKYTFEGRDLAVPLDEPARDCAAKGFAASHSFEATSQSESSVTLELNLPAQRAFPFQIHYQITYSLGENGLEITSEIENFGATNAPFAIGWHPWFELGGSMDACSITLNASKHAVVDESMVPVGAEDVSETIFDFRETTHPFGNSLEGLPIDDSFFDFADPSRPAAILYRADGRTTEVWGSKEYTSWQICTGDFFSGSEFRTVLAIEPMTSYGNSFNTGKDLVVLKPSKPFVCRWGIKFK